MLKVDIIIFKGIVINLYDITVVIFFSIITCRATRALRRPRLCIYRYAPRTDRKSVV